MVGIVVVSHSPRLADAAVELALQMAGGTPPPIEVAAGADGPGLGTDAVRVMEAIDRLASADGVLVLMDLGSAVLSAEMAVELRGGAHDGPILLSDAPLVEGLVVAVALAAAGASLAEIGEEASRAAHFKARLAPSGPGGAPPIGGRSGPPPAGGPSAGDDSGAAAPPAGAEGRGGGAPAGRVEFEVRNEHGLHARPAARLVGVARRFDAVVMVRDTTVGGPAVNGRSVSAVLTLGVPAGHVVEATASGPDARQALAAIEALARDGFGEPVLGEAPPGDGARGGAALAASPGIGIGPKSSWPGSVRTAGPLPPGPPGAEGERLESALAAARADVVATRDRVARTAGDQEAEIFGAHLLLLDDDELAGAARALIAQQAFTASRAWQRAVDVLATRFEGLADPYLRARAADVKAVGDQVLGFLHPDSLAAPPIALAGVVVVPDLSPAQAARLDPGRVQGVITASGSPLSHGAILARSLGIPAIAGAGAGVLAIPDGTVIVVDGSEGTFVVDPGPATIASYRDRAAGHHRRSEAFLREAQLPAVTTDGVALHVVANIASLADAVEAARCGADGVGVLRTEFLFLDRAGPPGEEEQLATYLAIAAALDNRRLTVRTLDIGGDKPVPYLAAPDEANPFLGRRGLRLSLEHPALFKQQLRAVIRAAQQYPVSVLFPMVSTLGELRMARALLAEALADVGCAPGRVPDGFEVGAMAEVPAFALHAGAMADLVDFISIGTNDLTQYTLAAERGNSAVAALADPLDPAVLRLISQITAAAATRGRVAVCGEVASDPAATALLVGLGVRELSVAPRDVPAVKAAIRSLSARAAGDLAARALRLDSAADVRALVLP